MSKLISPVQPLVLTTAGLKPTVPNPSTIMPTDSRFNIETDLMVGQFAYNVIDDIFYYRSYSGIRNLLSPTEVDPSGIETWQNNKIYKAGNIFVSYVNSGSADIQFQTESIYRCVEDTLVNESPETHPNKWVYQGQSVTLDPSTIIEIINVENAVQYNPTKENGYAEGAIVSYINAESPNAQFRNWALYLAVSAIATGISPEDDEVNWLYQGVEIQDQKSYPTVRVIPELSIQEITSYVKDDVVLTLDTLKYFKFIDTELVLGIKPNNLLSTSAGRWVEQSRLAYGKTLANVSILGENPITLKWNHSYVAPISNGVTAGHLRLESVPSIVQTGREGEIELHLDNSTNGVDTQISITSLVPGMTIKPVEFSLPLNVLAYKEYFVTIHRLNAEICTVKCELLNESTVHDTSLWEDELEGLIRPKNAKKVGVDSIEGLGTAAITNDYEDLDNLPDIEGMIESAQINWTINEW